ncbi:MAG: transporter substrate-binding domain-containing protein [Syntrophobacteraceae bacterium]
MNVFEGQRASFTATSSPGNSTVFIVTLAEPGRKRATDKKKTPDKHNPMKHRQPMGQNKRICMQAVTVTLLALLVGVLLTRWTASQAAAAHAVGEETVERPALLLANESLPPLNFMKNGKPTGLVVDLANALAQRMRRPVEIRLMNWAEAQQLVLNGGADALLQINSSPERLKVYDFSEPLLTSEFSIFTSSERPGIHSFYDLRGLRVGVERMGLPEVLLRQDSAIRAQNFPDILQGFRMLMAGELDAVVVDRRVGSYVLADNSIRGVKLTDEPISQSDSAIAVRKGNATLLEEINAALADIRRDGTYDGIVKSWQTNEVVFRTVEQVRHKNRLMAAIAAALMMALLGVAVLIREVHRRKRTEITLRKSETRFRSFFELSLDGIFAVDGNGRFLMANQAAEQMSGYSEKELQEITFMDICAPDCLDKVLLTFQEGIKGQSVEIEAAMINKDGRRLDLLIAGSPILDSGRVEGVFCLARDITAKTRAEQALRESENRYRTLFENMTEEVHYWQLVRDEAGRIKTWRLVDVNPPTLATWGHRSVDEIRGKTTDEIFGPGATEHYLPVVQQIMTEGAPYSFEDYFPNLDKYFRFTSVPVGSHFITTGADITSIKKAEQALRESEQRFRLALRNAPVSVAAQDRDLRYIWAYNQRTARPEEIIGHFDHDIFTAEEAERITEIKQRVLKEDIELRDQMWLDRPSGRIFLDVCWEPIHDQSGEVAGVASATVDLTPIKLAEEALKAALAEKEVLLKEIHHRVKNNMQVISSLVSLQAGGAKDETVRDVLHDVEYRVRSMALVHEKLYQSDNLVRIDFSEYVRSLVNSIWRAHGGIAAFVRLTLDLEQVSLPVDTAIPCGLILNELVSNALKHAFTDRSEGEVRVSLKNTAEVGFSIGVSDNGTGLPEGFDWRQSPSLGLRLVEMLSGQLHATVTVSTKEGSEFTVVVGKLGE